MSGTHCNNSLILDFQQRCFDEVDEVITKSPENPWGQVEYEDISKLTYIHQVIKETLRLHPPGAMIARMTADGCQLGDYK